MRVPVPDATSSSRRSRAIDTDIRVIPGSPDAATLHRAIDFMRRSAERTLCVADVAAASFISVRGLQVLFQRHLHMSPMRYLRRIRLARVHTALLAADPRVDTVAGIATACGFQHYGHFAEHYREVYGCRPLDTLREQASDRSRTFALAG